MSIEKSKSLRGPKLASNKLFYSLRRPKNDKKRSALYDGSISSKNNGSNGADAVHSNNSGTGVYLTPQSTRHLKWSNDRNNNSSNNDVAGSSTSSVNNSIITDPMKSSNYSQGSSQQYSYPTDGFASLPNRSSNHGYYKSVFDNETELPNIRYRIDTDPAITCKKIVYRGNSERKNQKISTQSFSDKSPVTNPSTNPKSTINHSNDDSSKIIGCDGNSSDDSLDSAYEPEITAALDTIAMTLGFISSSSPTTNDQSQKHDSFRTTQSSPLSYSSSIVTGQNPQFIRQFNPASREALQLLRNTRSFSEKHKNTPIPTTALENSETGGQLENIHHRRVKSQVDRSSSSPVEWRKQKIIGALSPSSAKKSQGVVDQHRKIQSFNVAKTAKNTTNYSASNSPNNSRYLSNGSKRSSGSISSPVKWFKSATRSIKHHRSQQTSTASLQSPDKSIETPVFDFDKKNPDSLENVHKTESNELEGQTEVVEDIQVVKVDQQNEMPQLAKTLDQETPPNYSRNMPYKSQKLLNSLQTDRIEDLYSKFRNISANKKSRLYTGDLNPRVHSIENCESPESSSLSSRSSYHPKYIHISLSAFGYSPNNLQYPNVIRPISRTPPPNKKPFDKKEVNQVPTSRRSNSTSASVRVTSTTRDGISVK